MIHGSRAVEMYIDKHIDKARLQMIYKHDIFSWYQALCWDNLLQLTKWLYSAYISNGPELNIWFPNAKNLP